MAKDITITLSGRQGIGKSKFHWYLKPILKAYTAALGVTFKVVERQT